MSYKSLETILGVSNALENTPPQPSILAKVRELFTRRQHVKKAEPYVIFLQGGEAPKALTRPPFDPSNPNNDDAERLILNLPR